MKRRGASPTLRYALGAGVVLLVLFATAASPARAAEGDIIVTRNAQNQWFVYREVAPGQGNRLNVGGEIGQPYVRAPFLATGALDRADVAALGGLAGTAPGALVGHPVAGAALGTAGATALRETFPGVFQTGGPPTLSDQRLNNGLSALRTANVHDYQAVAFPGEREAHTFRIPGSNPVNFGTFMTGALGQPVRYEFDQATNRIRLFNSVTGAEIIPPDQPGAGLIGTANRPGKPGLVDALGNILLAVLYYVVWLTAWFLHVIIEISGRLLDVVLSMTRYADSPFVQTSWGFVRNLLNFVFILALLGMAFGTIAGIESYGARRLLPRIVIGALLVNFSLAIGGAIIGFANAIMHTELRAIGITIQETRAAVPRPGQLAPVGQPGGPGTQLSWEIAKSMGISKYFTLGQADWAKGVFGLENFNQLQPNNPITEIRDVHFVTNLSPFLGAVAAAASLFFIAIVFVTTMILFFVRAASLVILLILSPFPFVLGVVPGGESWSSKWWNKFISYAAFGPTALLFIVLKIHFLRKVGFDEGVTREFQINLAPLGGEATQTVMRVFLNTAFNGLFIFMALYFAREFSIEFAGWAQNFSRRLAGGAVGLGTWPARFIGEGIWARTGAPYLAAREEAKKLALQERRQGFFGRVGAGTVTPFLGKRARERFAQRRADEIVKDLKARGVGKNETMGLLARGGDFGAAAARYGLEKDFFDTAEEFESAIRSAKGGDVEALRKKYGAARPVNRWAAEIKRDDIARVLAGQATGEETAKVKAALRAAAKDVQKSFNIMKDEDLPKAAAELKLALETATDAVSAEKYEERPILPSANRMIAISERVTDPKVHTALENYIGALKSKKILSDATKRQLQRRGVIDT